MKRFSAVLLSAILILCLTPTAALAAPQATPITLGETSVQITEGWEDVYLSFTPDETAPYAFYSYNSPVDPSCRLLDSDEVELAEDDDGGEEMNFRLVYMLTAGKTYYYAVCFLGSDTGILPVVLEKAEYYATQLTILSEPNVTKIIKGASDIPDLTGMEVQVAWSDGQTDIWYGGQNNRVRGERVVRSLSTSDSSPVATLTLTVMGVSVSMEFEFIDDPVVKMELLAAPEFRLVEGLDGMTSYDDSGEYFYYFIDYSDSDFRIRFTMSDGSVEERYLYETLYGFSVWLEDTQNEQHWTLGDDNRLTVRFLDHSVDVPVTVVEDPVAGFEVAAPDYVELIENADGFISTYYFDSGEFSQYFRYDLEFLYDDLQFRILYKDGSSQLAKCGDYVDGGRIVESTDQLDRPWTLGNENYATFSYREFTADLPVHIVVNPVKRITVETNPTKEYYIGDPDFGYSFGDVYFLYPYDLSGIEFTVYYIDGSSKQYAQKDLDMASGSSAFSLNGYLLGVKEVANPEPGSCPATLTYMGCEAPMTITVKESPVQSVSLIKQPDKTVYYNGFFPDLRGAEFEIAFSDGTTSTVSVTDGSYDFFEGFLHLAVKDGIFLNVWREYTDAQEIMYAASCMGETCVLDCLTEAREKEIVRVAPIKADAQETDTSFTLAYMDGSTEEVTVKPVKRSNPNGGAYTFVNGGVISVDVREGEQSVWIMTVQDITVSLAGIEVSSLLKGDVDGNGAVNSTDARLVLQLSVDKITRAVLNAPEAADADGDGLITSTDARLILQYAVNKIADWP